MFEKQQLHPNSHVCYDSSRPDRTGLLTNIKYKASIHTKKKNKFSHRQINAKPMKNKRINKSIQK